MYHHLVNEIENRRVDCK